MMKSASNNRFVAILAGTALAVAWAPLWACSVPVFRYALERWEADPYEATLFYQGEISAAQQSLLEHLQSAGPGREANMRWRLVEVESVADSEGPAHELWESQRSAELPWLVVQSPATRREVWAGKLVNLAAENVFDSPMRREIARRLLSGQTAVWVLLEGPHASEESVKEGVRLRDEAALALMKQRLAEEQTQLKLPEIDEADIQNGLVDIDPAELKIAFSVLRLSRDDEREQTLREMLLATEDDLVEFQQPMAFPIFGRGRVLYALVGEGISAENIHAACVELTGPCTCQVKAQNLGADLLMAVAWDRLVQLSAQVDKPLPPLTGLAGLDGPLEERDESMDKLDESIEVEPLAVEPMEVDSVAVQELGKPADAVATMATGPVSTPPPHPDGTSMRVDEVAAEFEVPRSQTHGDGTSPLMVGLLVLFTLGVIGIAGASLLIARR